MRVLVVLAAGLVLATAPVSAAVSQSSTGVERREGLEREILRELNRVRAAHDLRPVREVPGLRVAAVAHSRAMLELDFFDHASTDGTSFDKRLRAHYTDRGWQTWAVGETLLATSEGLDARQMVIEWRRSKSHRAIILSPTWQDVGIGAQHAAAPPATFGGIPTTVVTADFGLRDGKLPGSRG
jgi:uncharacterized protein YkwD